MAKGEKGRSHSVKCSPNLASRDIAVLTPRGTFATIDGAMPDSHAIWRSLSGSQGDLEQIVATSFDGDRPFTIAISSTDPISKGATATVLRGEAIFPGGRSLAVALKIFSARTILDVEHMELIRREIHAARTVHHRFILAYTGSSVLGLHNIIISPLMHNGNLLQYLKARGMHTWQTLVRFIFLRMVAPTPFARFSRSPRQFFISILPQRWCMETLKAKMSSSRSEETPSWQTLA